MPTINVFQDTDLFDVYHINEPNYNEICYLQCAELQDEELKAMIAEGNNDEELPF